MFAWSTPPGRSSCTFAILEAVILIEGTRETRLLASGATATLCSRPGCRTGAPASRRQGRGRLGRGALGRTSPKPTVSRAPPCEYQRAIQHRGTEARRGEGETVFTFFAAVFCVCMRRRRRYAARCLLIRKVMLRIRSAVPCIRRRMLRIGRAIGCIPIRQRYAHEAPSECMRTTKLRIRWPNGMHTVRQRDPSDGLCSAYHGPSCGRQRRSGE